RRVPPRLVTGEEVALVEAGVRRLAGLDNFIIDVDKDSIVVYLPERDRRGWEELARELSPWGRDFPVRLPPGIERRGNYHPMMGFTLGKGEGRRFTTERWCFRGGIDGWFPLMAGGSLADQVARNCPHLGQESFFELM